MKFAVRYWSSLFPGGFAPPDTAPHWEDYSIHPATKLGLHNALLSMHDRNEILADDGGYYECAVFLVTEEKAEKLSPVAAEQLFAGLPHGELKWLSIGPPPTPTRTDTLQGSATGPAQLPLFPHIHTLYDDVDTPAEQAHRVDLDA